MTHELSLLPCGQQRGVVFICKARKNKLIALNSLISEGISRWCFLYLYVENFWKILPLADSCNCMIVAYEIDNFWFLFMVEQIKSLPDTAKNVRARNVGRGFIPTNCGSEKQVVLCGEQSQCEHLLCGEKNAILDALEMHE